MTEQVECMMQAKDIPDAPILRFLDSLDGEWANWFGIDTFDNPRSVLNAMPAGTPPKVALAKMKSLMRRGLVDGCACGCRGDFELTAAGRSQAREESN